MVAEANRQEIVNLMEQAKDEGGRVNAAQAAQNLRDAGYANLADQVEARK